MPTRNRRHFVPRAIAYFLRQDYPNRELVVLDDGEDTIADLLPEHPMIRYHAMPKGLTIGEKRNLGNGMSRGEIIIHWDDDDWMHTSRISRQVAALAASGAEICGTSRTLFYDVHHGDLWLYTYPRDARAWLCGGTLCYRRSVWERTPFERVSVGEDTRFIWAQPASTMLDMEDIRLYVATIHSANTSPRGLRGRRWSRSAESLEAIVGEDAEFYHAFLDIMNLAAVW